MSMPRGREAGIVVAAAALLLGIAFVAVLVWFI